MKKKNGKKWNKYLYAGIVMTGIAVLLGVAGFRSEEHTSELQSR